jgi:tetratricopeptide (TPR) repeat protein
MDRFNFYYYLGLAYYDRNDGKRAAITWYKRAEKLDSNSFNIYNSLGLAYDSIQEYD